MGPIHAPNHLVPHATACCQPHTLAAMPRPQPKKPFENCCEPWKLLLRCDFTSSAAAGKTKLGSANSSNLINTATDTRNKSNTTAERHVHPAMHNQPQLNRNSTRCREPMKSAICKRAPVLRDVHHHVGLTSPEPLVQITTGHVVTNKNRDGMLPKLTKPGCAPLQMSCL